LVRRRSQAPPLRLAQVAARLVYSFARSFVQSVFVCPTSPEADGGPSRPPRVLGVAEPGVCQASPASRISCLTIQRTAPSGELLSGKGSSLYKSQAIFRASRQRRLSEQVLYFAGRQEQTLIPTFLGLVPLLQPVLPLGTRHCPHQWFPWRNPSGPSGHMAAISPCGVPGLAGWLAGWSSPSGCCRRKCDGGRAADRVAAFCLDPGAFVRAQLTAHGLPFPTPSWWQLFPQSGPARPRVRPHCPPTSQLWCNVSPSWAETGPRGAGLTSAVANKCVLILWLNAGF